MTENPDELRRAIVAFQAKPELLEFWGFFASQ